MFSFQKCKIKTPLPGLSTLQRWASTFDIRRGLLVNVFKHLEVAKSTLKDYEFENWQNCRTAFVYASSYRKQTVYIEFDKQMTKNILVTIIHKLNEIGYTVEAYVSDMGGGNVGLWKELNISIDNTSFNQSFKRWIDGYCARVCRCRRIILISCGWVEGQSWEGQVFMLRYLSDVWRLN